MIAPLGVMVNLKIGKSGAVLLSTMLISVSVLGAINLLMETPPTANAGSDMIVEPNTIVQFDGSGSTGDDLEYIWYFRTNEDVGSGLNPTHTFTEEGTYEVGLLVKETASSMMDLDITKITVLNQIPGADAGPDQVVDEDDIVTFDANGTTDTDSDLPSLIYEWDFADGTLGTGIDPTHVYTLAGTYPVILTVTDDGGAVGRDTVAITVNNPAPTANAGNDQTVNEGELVYLDGSGSTDTSSDADSLRYGWNFGDIGSYAANYWKDNGVYPATLTVTDDDGTHNQNTMDVSVQNVDPFICIDDAYLIADITLRASGEKWHDINFYLNESGTSSEEFYVYREAGDPKEQEDTRDNIKLNLGELWTADVYYTPLDDPINGQLQGDTPVWIILKFDNGVTRKISHNFNVQHPDTWNWNFNLNDFFFQNPQPAIHFGYTVYDPGMDSETVTWECGGNTVSKYYEASMFPTLIKDTMDYIPKKMLNITITVDDDDGGTYSTVLAFSESCMLDGISPKVSAGANLNAIEDNTAIFAGSADTTVSRTIMSYQWKFGDGSSATGSSADHIYTFSGTYYAVLRAWDDLGNVGIDIVKVEIANGNPTAEAGLDKVTVEDSVVVFDGSGSTDTPSDISSLVYKWNFGDGNIGYGVNPSHVYSDAGTYSVTLTVTDNDGAISSDTLTVMVSNVAPTAAYAGPDRTIYGASMSIEFIGVGFDTFSDVLGLVYNWNFGDGNPGTGRVTSHIYTVASTYTVTLTITDDNNAVATDTCTIKVGIDSDGDNLGDTFEANYGTNSGDWDSDTDYISDYWEIYTYDTDPSLSDTDDDGLTDWYEIAYLGYDVDVDNDGLMCPRDWDSDGDWIKDGDDPNPLVYNYADGTEASGDVIISVNNALSVTVVIDYDGTSTVKPTIAEATSPPVGIIVGVGSSLDITTTSTESFTAEIKIRVPETLPVDANEDRLGMYRWHGGDENIWKIEENTGVDVGNNFVWSKVTHFCMVIAADRLYQHSDGDGVNDWIDIDALGDAMVKVTINQIVELENCDSWPGSAPPFDPYFRIKMDDLWDSEQWTHSTIPLDVDNAVVTGPWTFYRNIPDDQWLTNIVIQAWDKDDGNPDDIIDINPLANGGVKNADKDASYPGCELSLTFNAGTNPKTWSGDQTGTEEDYVWAYGTYDGDGDTEFEAKIEYTIELASELDPFTKLELAVKYSPVLYFHEDENFFPCPVEAFVEDSDLYHNKDWNDKEDSWDGTPDGLAQFTNPDDFLDYCQDGKDTDDDWAEAKATYDDYITNHPEYKHTVLTNVQTTNDGKIVIQYWLFYVFNPNPSGWPVTHFHHEGDWEMVQVVLSSPSAPTPERIDFSQHYGGKSLFWSEICKDGWHPIVQVKHDEGHPSHHVPISQQSSYEQDLESDYYNVKLISQNYNVELIYYQDWLSFKGYWGASWGNWWGPSVRGPVLREGADVNMWIDSIYWGDQLD